MTPDRAARLDARADWLEQVAGMSRGERIAALPSHMHYAHTYGQMVVSSLAVMLGESSSCYAVDAAHHANRALDLIAALELSAKIEALEEAADRIEAGAHQGSWSTEMIARGLKLLALVLRAEAQP